MDRFMTKIIRGFMEKESERGIPIVLLAAESKPENTQLHAACKQEKLLSAGMQKTKQMNLDFILHSGVYR
ncbi:hypothetical protein [Bacillus safensis]|uniref:hypothetical protein n=1 Tax=Bacillus safensis TaxID=561879 RepID=UPI003AA9258F